MRKLLKGTRRSQAGLTLIEVLVSMIIMTVISTMLVMGWISLQRSYAFTRTTNAARATARDALDRMSSEVRASQPQTTASGATQFYLPATPTYPYMCGPTSCVFYSAYNNSAAADGTGLAQVRLTALWLDTSGGVQKTLYWQRDMDNNGFDANDRKIVLATDVVNTAAGVSKNIFTYYFRNLTTGVWSHSSSISRTTTDANYVGNLRNIQIELIIDANLSHTPTYVDLRTTIRPRNAGAAS
jgi:prepilin-type N-terminal cleavage/methylation domain-containing protein